jgi:hypothetical protein
MFHIWQQGYATPILDNIIMHTCLIKFCSLLLVPIAMYTCNLNAQRLTTILLLVPITMYTYNLNAQMLTQEIQLNFLIQLAILVNEFFFTNEVTTHYCWNQWCILENWISIVALHIIETTHIVSLDTWTMCFNFWFPSLKHPKQR